MFYFAVKKEFQVQMYYGLEVLGENILDTTHCHGEGPTKTQTHSLNPSLE